MSSLSAVGYSPPGHILVSPRPNKINQTAEPSSEKADKLTRPECHQG